MQINQQYLRTMLFLFQQLKVTQEKQIGMKHLNLQQEPNNLLTQKAILQTNLIKNKMTSLKEPKKPFKIKKPGDLDEKQKLAATMKANQQILKENDENVSFIDQIRKKFNEQQFMKREDVLKLLKQIQTAEVDKIKHKVFDQNDVLKGFSNNIIETKLFNQTTSKNFLLVNAQNPTLDKLRQKQNMERTQTSFPSSTKLISSQNKRAKQSRSNQGKYKTDQDTMFITNPAAITTALQEDKIIQKKVDSNFRTTLCDSDKEDQNSLPRQEFHSLRQFENQVNKAMASSKRSKTQCSNVGIFGNQILPPNYVYDQTQIFQDCIIGDKLLNFQAKSSGMNKIQSDLYEMYMNAKLTQVSTNSSSVNNRHSDKNKTLIGFKKPPFKQNQSLLPKSSYDACQFQQSKRNSIAGLYEGLNQNLNIKIGPPRIVINVQPSDHLKESESNIVIKKINEFILTVIKQKVKISEQNLQQQMKYFNINISRVNGFIDQAYLKTKDFLIQANEKLLSKLYKTINSENGNVEPLIGGQNCSFYIGKGNNSQLVRQIIKRRVWWSKASKEDFGVNEEYQHNGCNFIWTQWKKPKHLQYLQNNQNDKIQIYNRLNSNFHLSNKKALFSNIVQYYNSMGQNPFEMAIPLTFHIKKVSQEDIEYRIFIKEFQSLQKSGEQNVWIIKPGENTNRGCGIQVSNSLNEIQSMINQGSRKSSRTFIVQKYIEKPLLINGRKFDIRCYALMTSINGYQKGYFYKDCYFRTSSKEFSISNLQNRLIHLTNDAIQKNADDYGKYENGNKLSINDFQRYLDNNFAHLSISFMRDIFSQIERLVTDTMRAVYNKIDPTRIKNAFELFGYDFMIDENFRIYLIEANTNPCLEISCPLLARIIPEVVDNSFRIAIDPLFQPSQFQLPTASITNRLTDPKKKKGRKMELLQQIKYVLVFDEKIDVSELQKLNNQGVDGDQVKLSIDIAKEEERDLEAMEEEEDADDGDDESEEEIEYASSPEK